MTDPDDSRASENRYGTESITVRGTIPGGPRSWIAQALITGLCVVAAIVSGVILAPRSLAPKPLDQAAPATAAALRSAIDTVSAALDSSGLAINQALGTGTMQDSDNASTSASDQQGSTNGLTANSVQAQQTADATADPTGTTDATPIDDTATQAEQAYSTTWLTADTIAVTAANQDQDQCRTLMASAQAMLDPAQTIIGLSDQTNASANPAIVSLSAATSMPDSLNQCVNQLDQAVANMNAALGAAKNAAAELAAGQQNQSARDDLQTALTSAQASLASADDKPVDQDLLTTLSNQMDAATAVLAITIPTSGWKSIDDQMGQIVLADDTLSAAAAAVDTAVAAIHVYTGKNGDLDPATLCPVPYDTKQLLRCDAEAAWMKLDAVYKKVWGEDIPIDLSYRTYDEQVEMKAIYGAGAATPGFSNHGWGIAVDLPDYRETEQGKQWNYGEPKYEWMKANGPTYGWSNPAWAVDGGSGPHEPWHFEYHK
ncbi:MAG: M15 family metallopeptidase [Propionibacteriaceae bacterium]|nr:M15 family metallopeptidase [Propionibacteriaceae bacterium]